MSDTDIYGVKSNGDVIFVDKVGHAYRGAMHVWVNLSQKYGIEGGMFDGGFRKLWGMVDKGTLSESENIVLKSTFNSVVVKKEAIPMLLEAYKEYDKNFPNSSLLEQVDIIEQNILKNDEMIGVCWEQQSIYSDSWRKGYGMTDEDLPYNVFEGERHSFLTA